ncbi:O-antigen polymerase [Croceicoccus sp. BE223]|uniref:O-antigen polymerase n=1 Tax=Croceicoccus sp. BE223 TaxID=2817716 RepID=UPI00285632C4|nr:O-antigen polymerase [Croceicoccus sp. BE223]MDR7102050.1 oligosaccharide repeat unit polymerase [Croceicoccus sp. BE223]
MYDFVLLASLLVFVGTTLVYVRQPAACLMHPATIYSLFHGFIFVLRPIVARISDFTFVYTTFGFYPSLSDKITVILAANLGYLTFMAVSLAVARDPVVFRHDPEIVAQRRTLRRPFVIAALLLAPVSIAAILYQWNTSSNLTSTMIYDETTRTSINTTGSGYFYEFQLVGATLAVLFAWLFRFRLWSLLPFGLFVLLKAGSGGRGAFIYAAAMMIIFYLYDQRRRWPELKASLLGIIALTLFNLVVVDRGRSIRALFVAQQGDVYRLDNLKPLEHMDFANLEYFEYIVYIVPQRTGTYDYFLSNLQIFTEWVPRTLWPGKPAGPPVQLFNIYDYGSPFGMTLSLPGFGWFELGYLGVVIQCAAFAALFSLIYRRCMRPDANIMTIVTSLLFTAIGIVGFRDGSLLSLMKMTLFYLAIPLGLTWAIGRIMGIRTPGGVGSKRGTRPVGAASLEAETDGVKAEAIPATPAERRRRLAALVPAPRF